MGDLVDAIGGAGARNHIQASDLVIAVIAMTAPLWQAAHPAETLSRLITALCNGMTHPQ